MATQESDQEMALRIKAKMEKFGLSPTLVEILEAIAFSRRANTPEEATLGISMTVVERFDRGESMEAIEATTPTIAEWLAIDDDGRREERAARRRHFLRLAREAGDMRVYSKLQEEFRARGGHFLPWDPPDNI